MSTRTTLIVGIVLVLLAVTISLAVYDRLPDPMDSHWGLNNQVNGTISRFWGAFLMPLMALGMLGLFLLIPLIDPLKANIATFRPIYNAFIVIIVAFLLYMHVVTILWNLGYQGFNMSAAVLPGLGLLLIFSGLMMRQAKRNFFIGIRTPWTLSNDRVWAQTHRVGSVLFVACGFLTVFSALLPGVWGFALTLLPLMMVTTFLLAYSYYLYQQETRS
ncbi:MAG TPA: SdpI family protein [Anaerolineales bacterium]|nr:SdpI family protein [Anaerolineales bacterium]